jgi:hypothetical protein
MDLLVSYVTAFRYKIFFYTYSKDIGYRGWHGIIFLGIVVLAVTGVEALYADLGHFGARPIRMSWLGVVYPLAKRRKCFFTCYFRLLSVIPL